MTIQLTERDVELIRFINDFGFCELPQIQMRFNLKSCRAYQIMKRLVEANYLSHERIFHNRHGVYRATNKGANSSDLPPLKKVNLASYNHDIKLIELYLKLREKHPEAKWISERQLKHDKFFDGVGKKGHIPNGVLLFPENQRIAIELELTTKNKQRLNKILQWYRGQFDIRQVHYYCSKQTFNFVKEIAVQADFVKVFRLEEFF